MANKFLIVCGGSGYDRISGLGLLGQRKILGIRGELHIDTREEVDPQLKAADDYSENIKLDPPVGTAPVLLVDMRRRINSSSMEQADQNHINYLCDYWPGDESLKDGLARSPAIGGGTIRHKKNVDEVETKLRRMVDKWAMPTGSDNPLEVWLISSTSGGTGEGTHRFVGDRLVRILSEKKDAVVKLHFIRVGQSTYNAVDPDRTALNTFFGIAADAAFKIKLPQDYPTVGVSTKWYYLEIPPVGVGPTARPIRARLIEVAAKAIMLDEMNKSLETITVNDSIGLVRVGYWGRDFDETVKYYETLDQLIKKLRDLTEPDYFSKYVVGKPNPVFERGSELEKVRGKLVSENYILRQMEDGWQFPKYSLGKLPNDPEGIRKLIIQWKDAINKLIAPDNVDELKPRFVTAQRVKKETGEWEERQIPLSVPALGSTRVFSAAWFQKIDSPHQVKAWCSKLLGSGPASTSSTEGLLPELHRLAKECSRAQYPPFPDSLRYSTVQKAARLENNLLEFIETLVKVIRLQELEKSAQNFLDGELDSPKKVLEAARAQHTIAKGALRSAEESPVIAAELSDELDRLYRETWLQLLDTAVRRQDMTLFKQEVLKGATGLTHAGLVSANVLGLRPKADIAEIKKALKEQTGRMYDAGGNEFQAQWWRAEEPTAVKEHFNYRILPMLEPETKTALGDGDGEIKYLYTEMGVIGLNVLAFEGAMISEKLDLITTPVYLMKGFTPVVQKYLDVWQDADFGRPNNKLNIVAAGVAGEPLLKPAMKDAGLTDADLKKIAEFYQLYVPQKREDKREA